MNDRQDKQGVDLESAPDQDRENLENQVDETPDTQTENLESSPSSATEPAEVQIAKDLTDEEVDAADAPDSIKRAYKRSQRKLQKERQATAELRKRLERIEEKFNQTDSAEQAKQIVDAIAKKGGLDEDSSKAFYEMVNDIIEAKSPKKPQAELTDVRQKFLTEGREKLAKLRNGNALAPFVEKAVENKYKELHALGFDPEEAFTESIDDYIYEAMQLMSQQNGTSQASINKNNANNLAGTESSKNGTGRNTGVQKMNQKLFDQNRKNLDWVKQNRDSILDAIKKGLIVQ